MKGEDVMTVREHSLTTHCRYWSTFRALLKEAYQEKLLRENINDYLTKIEWKDTKIEFLSLDE